MKLTIVSNFSFQVSSIQYSDSKELVLRLLSEQDLGGNRFSYEVDLGCGALTDGQFMIAYQPKAE